MTSSEPSDSYRPSTESQNQLFSESSLVRKSVLGLVKAIASPRSTLSWIIRGQLAKDNVFVSQTYWHSGSLPRVPLSAIVKGIEEVDVNLPRAFDRKTGTSISVEEASHLAALAKSLKVAKVLEIGTFDGNTALVLAANLPAGGQVVTLDLPPDFGMEGQHSLAHSDVELNLTPRQELGRQYRGHPLASRIRQVYGDSAALDWSMLGGPFDLVFIDGCHSEIYVESDTRNALKHLRAGGTIVWHDYGQIPDVSNAVDRLTSEITTLKACVLEGTRLAVGFT